VYSDSHPYRNRSGIQAAEQTRLNGSPLVRPDLYGPPDGSVVREWELVIPISFPPLTFSRLFRVLRVSMVPLHSHT